MPKVVRTALQFVREKLRKEFMDNLAQAPGAAAPIFEEIVRRLNQGTRPTIVFTIANGRFSLALRAEIQRRQAAAGEAKGPAASIK
jgi:ribosomal protein S7